VIAFSRRIPIGKAWHVAIFIIGHWSIWRGGKSLSATLLATHATAFLAALSALASFRKGHCYQIWCVLLLRRADTSPTYL
jgi:hypothetical protein